MNKEVLNFFKTYSSEPARIDRLIVSCFLNGKKKVPKASFLNSLLIQESDPDYKKFIEFSKLTKIDSLEKVIEAFEFVVSPAEKIVTGAVYTPVNIREYIIEECLATCKENLKEILIADIACGCAGFLLTAAEFIQKKTNKKYYQIVKDNLWGLDIADYSIRRSKIILSLLAFEKGEDVNLEFNLFIGNALDFSWIKKQRIKENGGFDIVVGNPPYVASRNIDQATMNLLAKWEVTKTGHPDLYIPFFQIGMDALKENGVLGYITVNTFFKSINGRALREYFSREKYGFTIIDFRGEQVFKKKSTYTCLCFIQRTPLNEIRYYKTESQHLKKVKKSDLTKYKYESLADFDGWNLGDAESINTIHKIESFPNKIFPDFIFSTGIATLKNSVYKFKQFKSNGDYYRIESNGIEFDIEKKGCRDIINSNKVTTAEEINALKQKIIFPYEYDYATKRYEVIPETKFRNEYPFMYAYLVSKKTELAKRDKGDQEGYPSWYTYGRNQGLALEGLKLFLPHITDGPHFVLSRDKKLLFCNGEAIVSPDETALLVLKRILESKIFWYYIVKTSKPYSSGFYSLGKNYIKSFSWPVLSEADKQFLIEEESDNKVLTFLLKKYGIARDELDFS